MPSKLFLHANSQLHCMKKAYGCFDEQALQVLQMLRDSLKTVRCLSSPVVIKDKNCMRAHRIRLETGSIFELISHARSQKHEL